MTQEDFTLKIKEIRNTTDKHGYDSYHITLAEVLEGFAKYLLKEGNALDLKKLTDQEKEEIIQKVLEKLEKTNDPTSPNTKELINEVFDIPTIDDYQDLQIGEVRRNVIIHKENIGRINSSLTFPVISDALDGLENYLNLVSNDEFKNKFKSLEVFVTGYRTTEGVTQIVETQDHKWIGKQNADTIYPTGFEYTYFADNSFSLNPLQAERLKNSLFTNRISAHSVDLDINTKKGTIIAMLDPYIVEQIYDLEASVKINVTIEFYNKGNVYLDTNAITTATGVNVQTDKNSGIGGIEYSNSPINIDFEFTYNDDFGMGEEELNRLLKDAYYKVAFTLIDSIDNTFGTFNVVGKVEKDVYSKAEVNDLVKLSFSLKDYQVELKSDFAVSSQNNAVNRKKLTVQNGMGVLNLDIVKTGNGDVIGYFPADAPLPTFQVSSQTADGGVITLNAKSRTISSTGLQTGKQYIVNIVSFFN